MIIVEKRSLAKCETLNYCNVKRSTIQYGKVKSNYLFKNSRNWPSFTLPARCLVDIILFLPGVMVHSSWCTLCLTTW